MNTIRRARRRPRVDSLSFRTCWWLIAYEAAFRIMSGHWSLHRVEPLTRRDFVEVWPKSWRTRAARILRADARWRFLP